MLQQLDKVFKFFGLGWLLFGLVEGNQVPEHSR